MCHHDSENHEGNSMTIHSETNFLETNFLNKLILHSFQCIISTNIPHRVHDHRQRKNFPFFNEGFQNFWVNYSVMNITKKSTYNFLCSLDTFFPCELTIQKKNYLKLIKTKLLHSFLKI